MSASDRKDEVYRAYNTFWAGFSRLQFQVRSTDEWSELCRDLNALRVAALANVAEPLSNTKPFTKYWGLYPRYRRYRAATFLLAGALVGHLLWDLLR